MRKYIVAVYTEKVPLILEPFVPQLHEDPSGIRKLRYIEYVTNSLGVSALHAIPLTSAELDEVREDLERLRSVNEANWIESTSDFSLQWFPVEDLRTQDREPFIHSDPSQEGADYRAMTVDVGSLSGNTKDAFNRYLFKNNLIFLGLWNGNSFYLAIRGKPFWNGIEADAHLRDMVISEAINASYPLTLEMFEKLLQTIAEKSV
jgi:hypothetical protein